MTYRPLKLAWLTAAENAIVAKNERELIVDVTNNKIILHDGVTVGGRAIASEQYVNERVTSGLLPPRYLGGLTLSNNGSDAVNDIDIASGACTDSTGAVAMIVTASMTKRLDAAWAAGTGNGGLDAGSAISTYDAAGSNSVTIGTGSKNFTIQSGKTMPIGNKVRIVRTSAPTKFMEGVVSAYSGTSLDVTVTQTDDTGGGTFSDWTINAEETFHVHIIRNPTSGAVDTLFSTSPSAPTLTGGYTQFRRIGSALRGMAKIYPFRQYGDLFKLNDYFLDRNSVSATASTTLLPLTVPSGIKVQPLLRFDHESNGTAGTVIQLFGDGDAATAEYTGSRTRLSNDVSFSSVTAAVTNTARQIRYGNVNASNAASSERVFTDGWVDSRGR